MYRLRKKVLLLFLVGLVSGLASSRVDAQQYHREYKSGWYSDPIFSSPSSPGVGSSYDPGLSIGATCPSCGMPGYAGEMLFDPGPLSYALPHEAVLGAGGSTGSRANCPPPTNALLRVWVDEHAMVRVNGVKTKPQRLGGVHRGSRVFSLTGLTPDEIQEVLVEVEMFDAFHGVSKQEKTQTVQAGGSYELRFHNVDFEQGPAHGELEHFPPEFAPPAVEPVSPSAEVST